MADRRKEEDEIDNDNIPDPEIKDDEFTDRFTFHPSPDDALQPPDDIYNPDQDQVQLEEDHDPPADPARTERATPELPPDHPQYDSNIEFQELYDEGPTGATDVFAQTDEPADPDEPFPLEPSDEDDETEPDDEIDDEIDDESDNESRRAP